MCSNYFNQNSNCYKYNFYTLDFGNCNNIIFYNNNFAQTKQLQESETANFKTLKGLVNFIHKKSYSVSKRNILFDKYILFDYVLNDTSKERIDNRVALFDGLFSKFQHFIDSAGLPLSILQ